MSEFNQGRNNENESYNLFNELTDYTFIITDSVKLSPVKAYTFLTYVDELQPSIIVLRDNIYLVSLSPEYGTTNYTDGMSGYTVQPDPYSIFQFIKMMDDREVGTFKDVYEKEYRERKAAGEEVYNPFSETNLNWKSVARMRKNTLKSSLPQNFNKRFRSIKKAQPYGTWYGATPNSEKNRKMRSRKTRKTRR
jgi:hypothetical protein